MNSAAEKGEIHMKPVAFVAALCVTAPALAHFDIRPRVQDSKIVTDGFEDATSTTEPGVHVFGYDFGENADDPFFAQDPGFNATATSGLTPSAAFRFNILSPLSYWNGAGDVSFAPVATGESLRLNFGANDRTISGISGVQAGFSIQTVDGSGAVHRHLNAFLSGADGNTIPAGPGPWGAGDGVQAPIGAYLFSLELLLDPAGAIANSDPIYIVFNNGLSEALHDVAIDWVNQNLVPEPALAGVLAPLVMRGRRRRQIR
jgi:hypothetical protein